jgi:hypothetical protein
MSRRRTHVAQPAIAWPINVTIHDMRSRMFVSMYIRILNFVENVVPHLFA